MAPGQLGPLPCSPCSPFTPAAREISVLGCMFLTEVQGNSADPSLVATSAALAEAGGAASDSPAAPRPAALRGKGKLLLRSGLGRAQCGCAPCMPGPQSLQAPHRPPEWGQVNVAMARTIPFPDEETHVAAGRLPGREGQRQHPDPERGGGKPSAGKARLLAPHSRPCGNVGGAGVSALPSSACTCRPAGPPRDANVRVHTTTWALVVPGIPSPGLGPTHMSCKQLSGGARTWWVPAAT